MDENESIGTYTPISDLKEWKNNPRKNDHAVEEVAKSIKRFGFASPIIARKKDKMVIAGHTRLAAARVLNIDVVPVRFVDLDPTEAQLLALADNKIGEIADWDQDLLSEVLTDLKDADLTGIGFSDAELDELIQEAQVDQLDNVIEGDLDDQDWDQMPSESVKIAKTGGVYQIGGQQVACGDCVEVMRSLPDNSVDSIVTDAPYGIGFMSRDWDHSVPSEEWARECLRVLKDGGHLICFAATRTVHRLAVAVEDAGFEIRDQLGWCYYSGFPKSMDISKQIDKMNGRSPKPDDDFREYLRSAIKKANLTQKDIDRHCGTNGMVGHWVGRSQPEYPTLEHWEKMKEILDLDDRYDEEIKRVEAEREVVGSKKSSLGGTVACGERDADLIEYHKNKSFDITKPATKEAQYWEGWGTALKPAYEPCVLARKPIAEKNVASQVLKSGTGAINIDACRFGYGDPCWIGPQDPAMPAGRIRNKRGHFESNKDQNYKMVEAPKPHALGRWPANLYQCPKPSRSEREQGLADLEAIAGFDAVNRKEGSAGVDNPRAGAGRTAGEVKNFHPTVKPVNLMRWLIRLVTPVNGLVLEPFLGSGTTGVASSLEGFRSIGIEKDSDYADICLQRISHAAGAEIVEIDKLKIERLEEETWPADQS